MVPGIMPTTLTPTTRSNSRVPGRNKTTLCELPPEPSSSYLITQASKLVEVWNYDSTEKEPT